MNDPRVPNIDPGSWAYESLIGQPREWTPRAPVRTVTSSTNVNPRDGTIFGDATSAAITLTLETAVGADGRPHEFKKIDSSSNDVTIDGNGSETIDGATTYALSAQYDAVVIRSNGTNWEIVSKSASGGSGGTPSSGVFGQCILTRNSATELILSRHRGKYVTFASGVTVEVPSAGVTVSNSGLSADTSYFVYAVTSDDDEVTSLEFSATGYDIDSTYGLAKQQGVGNDTRLLQGMVKTNGSSQFTDSAAQRLVRTWNNDKGVTLSGASVSGSTSAGPVAVTSVGASTGGLECLLWADERVDVCWQGYAKNSTAGANVELQMYLNGAVTTFGDKALFTSGAANEFHAFNVRHVGSTGLEGYNFINGYLTAASGTASINACRLMGHTRGGGS